MTIIWCRWQGCHTGYVSIAGDLPKRCPGCLRESRWTTTAPVNARIPVAWDRPMRPYSVTDGDVDFLKSIRILTDDDDRWR